MNKALLYLLLLSAHLATGQSLEAYHRSNYKDSEGNTLSYRILYPQNYDSTKTYPLVLFLHGAGERGNDNESQLTHGARLFLDKTNREKFPAIVLFPQCPSESYWSSVIVDRSTMPLKLSFDYSLEPTPALTAAINITKELIAQKKADKSQIYIMGLSMGGMGTFEAVHRFPKLFAAALPICGGGDVDDYNRQARKVPFWVFHGAADAVVNVELSRKMVQKLKEMKVEVRYTEYPGVDHNSWDSAFQEPELLTWMFSHKR